MLSKLKIAEEDLSSMVHILNNWIGGSKTISVSSIKKLLAWYAKVVDNPKTINAFRGLSFEES